MGVVPPFVGTAVNVTEVPVHTAPEGAADILTLTGSWELTEVVIEFEVAGLPETHVEFDVSSHVTTSLFAGV